MFSASTIINTLSSFLPQNYLGKFRTQKPLRLFQDLGYKRGQNENKNKIETFMNEICVGKNR